MAPPSPPHRYDHVGVARYFDAIGQLHTERDVMQRLLDRWLPPLDTIASWKEGDWKAWLKQRALEHVGDHSMLEYLRLLAGVDELRRIDQSLDLVPAPPRPTPMQA